MFYLDYFSQNYRHSKIETANFEKKIVSHDNVHKNFFLNHGSFFQ